MYSTSPCISFISLVLDIHFTTIFLQNVKCSYEECILMNTLIIFIVHLLKPVKTKVNKSVSYEDMFWLTFPRHTVGNSHC